MEGFHTSSEVFLLQNLLGPKYCILIMNAISQCFFWHLRCGALLLTLQKFIEVSTGTSGEDFFFVHT